MINGEQEKDRRLRQINKGSLKKENGLDPWCGLAKPLPKGPIQVYPVDLVPKEVKHG